MSDQILVGMHEREVGRVKTQVERMKLVGPKLHAALERSASWAEGVSTAPSKGSKSKGTVSRPTEAIALRPPSTEALLHGELLQAVDAYVEAGRRVRHLVTTILAVEKIERDPTCGACTKPAKRIRADYCDACYTQWQRKGRPDRPSFERSRKEPST